MKFRFGRQVPPTANVEQTPADRPAAQRTPSDRLSAHLGRIVRFDVALRTFPTGQVEALAPALPGIAALALSRAEALEALRRIVATLVARPGAAVAATLRARDFRAEPRYAGLEWTDLFIVMDPPLPG